MKHIIVCLLCSILLFTYIGRNTVTQEMMTSAAPAAAFARVAAAATNTTAEPKAKAARMAQVSTTQQVGILMGHADELGTARFKNAFEKNLGQDVKVNSLDCAGTVETQKTMFDKMVQSGYNLIVLELIEGSPAEEFVAAAGQGGVPLILIGQEPESGLLTQYPGIYYMGFSDEDIALRMAEETFYFWENNPKLMNFEKDDWDLTFSAITSTGFAATGARSAFAAAMQEQGVSTTMEVDSVVQAYEYDLHKEIDQTIIKDSEIVFYNSSIEAQKAINYFYDPTEFSKRPKQQLALSVIDEAAAKMVKDGEVLFACGTDTTEQGKIAARLAIILMAGQTPSFQNMEMDPDGGQRFYLPITVLRANIAPELVATTEA